MNGGSGSFSYSWSPSGGSSNVATGLSAGNYTVTITDANGCTTSLSTTVTQPTTFTLSTSTTSATCGAANGSATANLTGGTGPFTYNWSPSGGNTATASNLSAGSYTVTVSDANGCSSTAAANVTSFGGPTVTASIVTPISCFGASTGSATVSVSNGTGPFTYSWSPSGGSAATATNLGAGTYTVSVSDVNGCSSSNTITLTQPAAMSVQASSNPVNCFGGNNGSASTSVSGGSPTYTYNWLPGNATTSAPTGLTAGNYTVTVTDAGGCTMTASTTVAQPAALTAITTPTAASCNGSANGSILVTTSGGTSAYSYNWFPSGGTNATASSLAAGTYTVTVTDAHGCTVTSSAIVTEPAAISLSTSTTPASCGSANGSASVAASGGAGSFTYNWQPSGGSSANASNLSAGSYSVLVTDANGCTSSMAASVSNTGGPTITASVVSNVSCFGGNNGSASVSVSSGTAPYTYQWSPSGGSGINATNLIAGNYSVNVVDANGCISVSNVNITQPTALAVQASSTPVSCAGYADGTATAQAAGGISPYNYEWNPGTINTIHATGLIAGNYAVTVTDANNCTLSASASVTQPTPLNTSISSTPAACFGSATGTATVSVNGGSGSFTYSWLPSGGTNNTATNLAAGNYSVTITDANGCTTSVATVVGQAPAMTIATTNTPSSCGSSNGSANAIPTGGTAPYSYSWTPSGGSNATANNLAAGAYVVTITDAGGCTASASTLISNTGGPTVALSNSTNVSCNGGSNGSATVSANGGTSPYTYNWSPYGGSAASATSLSAGNYSVVVADANGCQSLFNVTITEPAGMTIQTSSTPATCGSSNGTASITVSGGTSNYTYAWSGISGATGNSAANLLAGNYSVIVTDGAGCTQNTSVTVGSTGGANAMLQNSTDVSCNGGNNGSAIISATGGTAPFTYSWSPSGGNAASASGLQADTYVVTVTDASGCSTTVNVLIGEPSAINLQTGSTPASCNGGTDGSVSVVASGGQAPYTYSLQGLSQTTAQVTGLGIGNYTVIVTDANGMLKTAWQQSTLLLQLH
ncbi:MAG: SprB repeat-containing protein [Bacteroidetes bacterium]|nr:SprB repeat-containing protein [Bacteroidota bacterium]